MVIGRRAESPIHVTRRDESGLQPSARSPENSANLGRWPRLEIMRAVGPACQLNEAAVTCDGRVLRVRPAAVSTTARLFPALRRNFMRSWILYFRVLLVVAGSLPLRVSAYNISPNLLQLRPTGAESSAFLQLQNKGTKAVALELTIQEHHKDLDGQTVAGKEAEGDFLIFPAQLVMVPGDEVGAQVRWIGEPALNAERVYTLVTREVPIPRKATEEPELIEGVRIDVTVLINYEVRVYVTPKGARPKVVVESVTERMQPAGGGPGATESVWLEVILANQGTAREELARMVLVLVPPGSTDAPAKPRAVTLPAKDFPALRPHLLAGDRRRVLIPRPAAFPAGPVRIILSE